MQARVVTVSEVNEYLRILTESDAFLADLWVEGEVLTVSRPGSGHLYFSLSDGQSSLRVVAWRANAVRFQHLVVQGARLIVGGHMSMFTQTGQVQLYADHADASGTGMQALELQRLRAKLATDGLFDPARKRALPSFPWAIGVVTSASGSVLHDIQTVLRRRFPLTRVFLAPAQVQGAGAVDSMLAALDLLIRHARSSVIIIARGGGSAEDLAAFNDERLARAVFASPIPIISAIGHETDLCILDDVADLRAPTPSAAAELATPDVADLALGVIDARERLSRALRRQVEDRRSEQQQLAQRLDRSSPVYALSGQRTRLLESQLQLAGAARGHIRNALLNFRINEIQLRGAGLRVLDLQRVQLAGNSARVPALARARVAGFGVDLQQQRGRLVTQGRSRLQQRISDLDLQKSALLQLNPSAVLGRGFSLLTDEAGTVIGSVQQVSNGDAFRAAVKDGTISARVTAVAGHVSAETR